MRYKDMVGNVSLLSFMCEEGPCPLGSSLHDEGRVEDQSHDVRISPPTITPPFSGIDLPLSSFEKVVLDIFDSRGCVLDYDMLEAELIKRDWRPRGWDVRIREMARKGLLIPVRETGGAWIKNKV